MVDCKWIFEILIISYTRQAASHMSLNQPFGRDHGVMDPIRTECELMASIAFTPG